MNNLISKNERLYLVTILILYIVYNIYLINFYPVYIDEAITFKYFTNNGFLTSITEYPFPNNHILFSLISNLFYYLPFDPLINLRIPNVIIGVILSYLTYIYLRNNYGHKTAIIPHTILTFSYSITFYSVCARGYMLIIFFTAICFFSIIKIIKSDEKKYYIIYTIASILGLFSIPIFIYITFSFIIYLLYLYYDRPKVLVRFAIYHIIIVIGVLLLYSPILYYNGLEAISNNEYTKPISFSKVFNNIILNGRNIYDKLLGIRSKEIIVIYLLSLLTLLYKTKRGLTKKTIIFVVMFLVTPSIIMLLHKVIPGQRTWSYLIVPFVLGLAILIDTFDKKLHLPKAVYYCSAVLIILTQSYIFKKSHPLSILGKDYESHVISSLALKNGYKHFIIENNNWCFDQENLEYHYLSSKTPYTILNQPNSLQNVNWDKYDCVFLYNKESTIPNALSPNYKLVFNNGTLRIFGRMN